MYRLINVYIQLDNNIITNSFFFFSYLVKVERNSFEQYKLVLRSQVKYTNIKLSVPYFVGVKIRVGEDHGEQLNHSGGHWTKLYRNRN